MSVKRDRQICMKPPERWRISVCTHMRVELQFDGTTIPGLFQSSVIGIVVVGAIHYLRCLPWKFRTIFTHLTAKFHMLTNGSGTSYFLRNAASFRSSQSNLKKYKKKCAKKFLLMLFFLLYVEFFLTPVATNAIISSLPHCTHTLNSI